MHPVIEHIKNRKNKSVPVNDGRKITLILLGGTMTGVRGASALSALDQLGFKNAFDDIYAMSAGLANAAGFLSGRIVPATSIYHEELSSRKFINFFRFSNIVDIDYLVGVLRLKKYVIKHLVMHHPTNLHTILLNIFKNRIDFINVKNINKRKFWPLIKVAMSVPYLNPGVTAINGQLYKDPATKDKNVRTCIEHCIKSDATDILIIYNRFDDHEIEKFFFPDSERVFSIVPDPKWRLGRLNISSKKEQQAEKQMIDLVQDIFK